MGFRLGVIGTGGFSHFSVKAFLKVPDIQVAGAYDRDSIALNQFCSTFDCQSFDNQQMLIESADTDLIYIATPPYLHHSQTEAALMAGKHVICEKPAALSTKEVKALIRIAEDRQLLYVVNLMQRYNPLFLKVQSLVNSRLLGNFLHGYFENYASDEFLNEDHWMWNEQKSGGIFIEHAVHFFDLIEGWLGKGHIVSSQKLRRKGQKLIWPEVQAICQYGDGLFNFYHGFHQASRMDRQELKLVFESGDITLLEWVPSKFILYGLVEKRNLRKLIDLFPEVQPEILETFEAEKKSFRSHFAKRRADFRIRMVSGDQSKKLTIYQDLLTDFMADQLAWLKDPNHKRRITAINALNSLTMAEMADREAIRL